MVLLLPVEAVLDPKLRKSIKQNNCDGVFLILPRPLDLLSECFNWNYLLYLFSLFFINVLFPVSMYTMI